MTTEVRTAPRWGNAVSGYLRYLKAIDRSDSTIYLRSWQLRTFSQAFRNRDPWSITGSDIEGFLSALDMARGTKRSLMVGIRGFYKYGQRRGLIVEDPTLLIENISPTVGKPRPASDSDIRAAIESAEPRVKMMIYLGAFLGLRRSEIAKVHTDDLVERADGPILRVIGKGKKERLIPVPDKLARQIREAEPGWLFPSWHRGMKAHDGRAVSAPLQPSRVGELLHAVLPEGVTPHQLRHRYASSMYQATGHDLRAVQEALGHASVATTQVYTYVPQSVLRGAAGAVGELL